MLMKRFVHAAAVGLAIMVPLAAKGAGSSCDFHKRGFVYHTSSDGRKIWYGQGKAGADRLVDVENGNDPIEEIGTGPNTLAVVYGQTLKIIATKNDGSFGAVVPFVANPKSVKFISVAVSLDGTGVCAGGDNGVINIYTQYKDGTWHEGGTIGKDGDAKPDLIEFLDENSIVFASKGTRQLHVERTFNPVHPQSPAHGVIDLDFDISSVSGHFVDHSLTPDANNQFVIAGGNDGHIQRVDVDTTTATNPDWQWKMTANWKIDFPAKGTYVQVGVSEDGKNVFGAPSNEDHEHVFDSAKGNDTKDYPSHKDGSTHLRVLRDGVEESESATSGSDDDTLVSPHS